LRESDYDNALNLLRKTTINRLFLAILFSFLTVVGAGSVACGDLLLAPVKGVGGKGWRGDKVWRDQVTAVGRGGDIKLNVTATRQEAIDLLEAVGCKIDRIEGPHLPPNPHQFPHINFTTPDGKKGTIPIVGL